MIIEMERKFIKKYFLKGASVVLDYGHEKQKREMQYIKDDSETST